METLKKVFSTFARSSIDLDSKYSKAEINEISSKGGQVFSFGYGFFGQLGHGDTETCSVPRLLPDLTQIIDVGCGDAFSIAISMQGAVYSWGGNKYGQLGLGDTRDRKTPVYIESLKETQICKVACGSHHTLLMSKKEIFSFGCGTFGRLGHGNHNHVATPRIIKDFIGKNITQISCGGSFSACISDEGSLYTWGHNKFGQLGHGKIASQLSPKHVTSLHGMNLTMVSCGKHHLIVGTEAGVLFACGMTQCGQTAFRSKTPLLQPRSIMGIPSSVDHVTSGSLHSMCLTGGGSRIYIWGYLTSDHLGISDGDEYQYFPQILNLAGVTGKIISIFAGAWHSGLITNEGQLYLWGFDSNGRLGDVQVDPKQRSPLTPVLVPFFKDYRVICCAGGGAHTIVVAIPKSPNT